MWGKGVEVGLDRGRGGIVRFDKGLVNFGGVLE